MSTEVYSKTARGRARLRSEEEGLARPKAAVLDRIDGKQSLGELTSSLTPLEQANFLIIVSELESQGLIRLPSNEVEFELPTTMVEVKELGPEESVRAWAEANRGSRELEQRGFYTVPGKLNHAAFAGRAAGLQVLVVDDDELLVKVLTLLLEEHGHQVTSAFDAMTAVAELRKPDVPDLVLLDVMLGEHNGFDILRAIRKDERLSKLAVIMVTALTDGEHVMKGLKYGADGYIFKPLKWETLYACIQAVTGQE